IVAALMAVAVAILFFTIRENKIAEEMEEHLEPEEKEAASEGVKMEPAVRRSFIFLLASIFFWFFSYNAVTTAFSKYAQDYLHIPGGGFANSLMLATVAAVVAFIPAGFLAAKIGRKKTILGGVT